MADSAEVYKLAYEEAVRALTEQQTTLQSLRTNAGILLSAAAIATSFLGGTALRAGEFTKLSWIAVAFFAALAAAIFGILWPRTDWEFVAAPRRLISTYTETEAPLPLPRVHRDLALHMENSYDANGWRLGWMVRLLRTAIVLLAAETVLWIVDLVNRA
jgi:hypothetical protein